MGPVSIAIPCIVFLVALIGVPLYFHLRANRPLQTPCHENLSVELVNPIYHSNGSIENDGDIFPEGFHFFTDNGTGRGCLCALKPCIRKCCNKDEYYVRVPGSRAKCAYNPGPSSFETFSLPVHGTHGNRVQIEQDHFRFLYGDVCGHGKYVLIPEDSRDKHDLLVDGRFRNIDGLLLDASNYCLESMNGSAQIRTFVCAPDPTEDEETKVYRLLFPIAMLITLPFLLATIVVYSILPGLRNLHGKCLVCQCTCLLFTYICLIIIQWKGENMEHFWCVFLAVMVQFTFLGAFFWLNVMSFDIWWSVSGRRPAKWGMKEMDYKKFLLYSLYAWGFPFVIVAATLAIDISPSLPDSFIKPDFGKQKCWFSEWIAALLYFYIPSGIVLVLNLVMFVSTAFTLHSHTRNERDKVRFRQYLRLFIIMGLNWTLELLSFLIGGPKSFWFVTDLSNVLQGVVIFFFFVCKRDVLRKLEKTFCPSWNLFGETSQDYSKSLSTSCDLTKTEIDILALKSLDESNESKS